MPSSSQSPRPWRLPLGGHCMGSMCRCLLKAVACSVLAQPVSASAAERNWSVYGRIMTPARSRTHHHARADKLVYCHEALHMQAKLQKAAYTQKAVKWDSDSDDDATDEEDLTM